MICTHTRLGTGRATTNFEIRSGDETPTALLMHSVPAGVPADLEDAVHDHNGVVVHAHAGKWHRALSPVIAGMTGVFDIRLPIGSHLDAGCRVPPHRFADVADRRLHPGVRPSSGDGS